MFIELLLTVSRPGNLAMTVTVGALAVSNRPETMDAEIVAIWHTLATLAWQDM